MTLKQRITDDMKAAMKAGDRVRLGCLRMLRSKLQEAELAARAKKGLDYSIEDDAALTVVATYAKQRRESIESYRKGGRDDLAAREEQELAVILEYLPQQMSEDEIREVVSEAVEASGASSPKDMGKVMKLVMPRVKGRADGQLVNRIVRETIGA